MGLSAMIGDPPFRQAAGASLARALLAVGWQKLACLPGPMPSWTVLWIALVGLGEPLRNHLTFARHAQLIGTGIAAMDRALPVSSLG